MTKNNSHRNEARKKLAVVAEAVAMNTVPEYWFSLKHAGMHLLSLLTVAKIFLMQHGINQ